MTALFDKTCTIYCRSQSVDAPSIISLASKNVRAEVDGDPASWAKIKIDGSSGHFMLTRTVFTGPGFSGPNGTFNSAVMGAGNYFKHAAKADDALRKKLITAISKTETLVGCVADPYMTAEHYDIIFGIARIFEGMIFDSDAMLDSNGIVILDKEGRSGHRRERPGEGPQ